ncbi:MAG TPA: hypothetical protein VHM65_02240, partial [Candidatus Lustribacter sp.]|nr:hypothetical protein [Candidatus Lustribacter sp.]
MVTRLATGEGWGLLESLPPYDGATVLPLQARLRAAGFDADLVAAVLTQSRLRARAVDKLGAFAAGMLFTDDGLEQATRLPLAARHAERFVTAGVATVHDLGCGIGADAMAFAGLDLAIQAIDADPATAAVATVNLRHFPEATVRAGLAETVALPSGARARHTGVWVDPARRVTGVADSRGRTRRVFALDAISPPWTRVQEWAAQVPAAGAKLSPALAHQAIPAGAEAEWVSWQGEVLECVVWFGSLARRPGRVASVCRRDRLPVSVAEADAHGGDATL